MTRRENHILYAVFFLFGLILGLWIYAKLNPKGEPLETTTEIIKWREIEKLRTDTITRVEKQRKELADKADTVILYVQMMDSSQLGSCTKDVEPRQLCLEHSLFPVLQAQVKNGDSLIGLFKRKSILSDSIGSKWREIAESATKGEKVANKRLSAAKKGIVGAGVVGLILGLIWK